MLAIRMQRTGRKGHAMFRVVVQDSRLTPTSGKVVALLGNYDPHSKEVSLDKEKAAFYLNNGAQPSDRVSYLLKNEGIKLPGWVQPPTKKERAVRNADNRRSTRPDEPATEQAIAEPEPDAEAAQVAESDTPAEAATAETEVAITDETEAAATENKSEETNEDTAAPEVAAAEPAPAENEVADTEKTDKS